MCNEKSGMRDYVENPRKIILANSANAIHGFRGPNEWDFAEETL